MGLRRLWRGRRDFLLGTLYEVFVYGLFMGYVGIWDMGYGWFVYLSAGYIWSLVWFGVDTVFRPGKIVEDLVILFTI